MTDMTRRLFHDKLHNEDSYSILFSRRWTSDRTQALREALQGARDKHCRKAGLIASAAIMVHAAPQPSE